MNNTLAQKYILAFKQNVFSKETGRQLIKKYQLGMFIFAAAGIALYLALINSMATQGYEMRELENRRNELSKINQELRVASANAQSGDTIRQRVGMLDLRPTVTVSYIDNGGEVAINR